MRLFLIRHAETVDNVAQLYAGVRDSALTNHGILQAERLGQHFKTKDVIFNNIFSSDLQRAFKTAEAIRLAQNGDVKAALSPVTTVQLPILREKDFGSYEGKPVSVRLRDPRIAAIEAKKLQAQNGTPFQDVESKESMIGRVDEFLDKYLLGLLKSEAIQEDRTVAVVSHGIILKVLWKCMLRRFPPKSVSTIPGVIPVHRGTSLEGLGVWSNTGYLELRFTPMDFPVSLQLLNAGPNLEQIAVNDTTKTPPFLARWRLLITAANETSHLVNLKRTGGGVGSSKHDSEQQKLEKFFKKPKIGHGKEISK